MVHARSRLPIPPPHARLRPEWAPPPALLLPLSSPRTWQTMHKHGAFPGRVRRQRRVVGWVCCDRIEAWECYDYARPASSCCHPDCNPFSQSRYAGGVTVRRFFLFPISALFPSRNHRHVTWGGRTWTDVGIALWYWRRSSVWDQHVGGLFGAVCMPIPYTSLYMGVRLVLFGDHHHHSHGKGGKASIGPRAQVDVAAANRAGRLELAYTLPSLLLASKAIEINPESNHTSTVSCGA